VPVYYIIELISLRRMLKWMMQKGIMMKARRTAAAGVIS
jgi:hypothetical protein